MQLNLLFYTSVALFGVCSDLCWDKLLHHSPNNWQQDQMRFKITNFSKLFDDHIICNI